MKKKFFVSGLILVLILGIALNLPIGAIGFVSAFDSEILHNSLVLIDKNSQTVLFDDAKDDRFPIASMTKLMTVLLTLENIESGNISLDDLVMVSENANGMGGSQIFLDANTQYKLSDLLKSVIVASANDSSVAIAEHIAGSENNFVKMMNEKVSELNLANTHYANCTGLPNPDGYSSAYDQAIILSKVLNFSTYHEFSSIWNEDFVHPSGRTTQMTNTNKLSRFYPGCIGGKTGSTNEAKYCLAVGAERNDMELIAVVLGAENSKGRFKLASDLLDYGFDNFESKTLVSNIDLENTKIQIKGTNNFASLKLEREFCLTTKKNEEINYSLQFNLPEILRSVSENQVVGNVEVIIDGKLVDTINILSTNSFNEASIWDYFKEIVNN